MRRSILTSICARLRDTRGFMLAEQLISIIFIGFLCVVVAAGLGAALSAYGSITQQANANNLLARSVELVSDELVYATSVEAIPGSNVSFPAFVSYAQHETVQFYGPEDGVSVSGIAYGTETASRTLVPAQGSLVPVLAELTYNEPSGEWTFQVDVNESNVTVASATMTVKRMGS